MSLAEELGKLQQLHSQGVLNDDEFCLAKARVMAEPLANTNPTSGNFLQHLRRAKNDVWIGGVCSGLGQVTPLPTWSWRVLFCMLVISFGVGVVLYILLWMFIPEA